MTDLEIPVGHRTFFLGESSDSIWKAVSEEISLTLHRQGLLDGTGMSQAVSSQRSSSDAE
ncbi:hypothetical protein C8J55DRAFT_506770 [Lentinula edodes]|uniref:Uncharacterized protein n=1 Tax=Lentinula lateritia TaxID=40482 RepID=A0A9W9AUQ6_9AGAR|nr:hypothetical protein C8J55DRAFT_506770 [Lentinula edodes]